MRLWPSPFRATRLLRRLLAEARLIRLALERQADALELQAGLVPREAARAQVFRAYSRTREPLSESALKDLTEVAYVDAKELAGVYARETELRALLGRDPTPEEVIRAYEGAVE